MKNGLMLLFIALLMARPVFAQEIGSITGPVSLANDESAVGARVTIWDDHKNVFETQADQEGAFFFEGVPIGLWNIRAVFGREFIDEGFEVGAGEKVEINLIFGGGGDPDAGSVSGTVSFANGEPAVGANVMIWDDQHNVQETQTDGDGVFSIGDVSSGDWNIRAIMEFEHRIQDRIRVVENENAEIDLIFEGNADDGPGIGSVSGTITDEDGDPVGNAAIIMIGGGRQVFQSFTDNDGVFSIERVLAGRYEVTVMSRDLFGQEWVQFLPDENNIINMILEHVGGQEESDEFGSVRGEVFNNRNEPVAGAFVFITDGFLGIIDRAVCNDEGEFSIEEVPIGVYTIIAEVRGIGSVSEQIRVASDEETNVRLVLEENGGGDGGGNDPNFGGIDGIVSNANGTPAVHATVTLYIELRGMLVFVGQFITREDGIYGFGVPACEYHLVAELEDVGVAECDVVVIGGERIEVNLVLGDGDIGGNVSVDERNESHPVSAVLLDSYPNPFNPVATVDYNLPEAGFVSLTVFNTAGQRIQTLAEGWQSAGEYQTVFKGHSLPAGTYILRLDIGKQTQVRQLRLVK